MYGRLSYEAPTKGPGACSIVLMDSGFGGVRPMRCDARSVFFLQVEGGENAARTRHTQHTSTRVCPP